MRRKAAINAPMQEPQRTSLKIAVDNWLQTEKPHADMLMQVHDELFFEVKESELERVSSSGPVINGTKHETGCAIKSGCGSGDNWDEALIFNHIEYIEPPL